MNIRNELDSELSEMKFESIKARASEIRTDYVKSPKIKIFGKKITAAAAAFAAVLTLGISVAAIWGISGLAGKSIKDLTADECTELEGFIVAETDVSEKDITVNSVLYDGKLLYVNLRSESVIETVDVSYEEDYRFDEDADILLPGMSVQTEGTFNPVSGVYGADIFSAVYYTDKSLAEGENVYVHILMSDRTERTVEITIPQISAPKVFTLRNSEGESFEIHITPLSAVCKDTGRLYKSYGGQKYRLPLHLKDADGNVIFNCVTQGSVNDQNDFIIPFETVADADCVYSVRLGDYFSE